MSVGYANQSRRSRTVKKLLIATTNSGKLAEIKHFLKDLPLQLVSLSDLKIKEKPDENYNTFLANAKHKARFYSQKSGLIALADDGGLEIDFLNGAPGVKSRRWRTGFDNSTDQELIDHTLEKLKNVPLKKRGAQLVTVLVLALPNGKVFCSKGIIRGIISQKPYHMVTSGFPYRSLLYLPEIKKFYHSQNMTKKEIEKYNHRGYALNKLKKIIKRKFFTNT